MLIKFNLFLFEIINAPANPSNLNIAFAIFCAQYLIYLPILVTAFCWLKKTESREVISKMILIIIVTLLMTMILRSLITSPRPFDVLVGNNFMPHVASNSFPSKHAAFIFSVAFSLLYNQKKPPIQKVLFVSCLCIALLVGWARVYLGVHWPLDILAAVLISFMVAYLIDKYWDHFSFPVMSLLLKSYRILFYPLIKLKITKY